MDEPRITQAELTVLEAMLPDGLTPDMRDVGQCLYVALVQNDPRCGQLPTVEGWGAQLHAWALQALMQLQYLASQIGGGAVYLAKGVTVHLTARDRKMCSEFRGDYKLLARQYGLTDMRVRQIVDTFLKAQYLSRQQGLPGLD